VTEAQERLESILLDLEVSPAVLRRDPQGRTWLPEQAQSLVESSDECRQVLHDFVDDELALLGALGPIDGPGSDPFFTARVVEALPTSRVAPALSPRRRAMLLGGFHVVAGILAYVVLTMVPESTARWAEQAHQVLSWSSELGGGMVLAVLGAVAALLVVLWAARAHTPAA